MNIDEKIQSLTAEIKSLGDDATEKYKEKDFATEDEIQVYIDEKVAELEELENQLAEKKYSNIDIEKEIQKMYATHNWSSGERCNGCAMKEHTTFMWKADGVRENWKEFKAESIKILELMKCEKKFK